MDNLILIALAVIYLGLMPLAYGGTISYFWNEFPILQDQQGRLRTLRARGLFFALFPLGPFVTVLTTGFYRYGFKW